MPQPPNPVPATVDERLPQLGDAAELGHAVVLGDEAALHPADAGDGLGNAAVRGHGEMAAGDAHLLGPDEPGDELDGGDAVGGPQAPADPGAWEDDNERVVPFDELVGLRGPLRTL
jgi:hypothetical protein